MASWRLSLLLLCAGMGCTKASVTQPVADVAQESASLPRQPLPVPDGSFSGEVEAAGKLEVAQDQEQTSFTIPLDTGGHPLQCFVYADIPGRSTVAGDFGKVMGGMDAFGTLQQAQLTEVLSEEDEPIVFLELLYRPPTGGNARKMKLMAYLHPRKSLLCMLPNAGEAKSFKRITLGLARSLRRPQNAATPLPTPDYVDIHLHRHEGALVGFDKYTVWKAATGRRRVHTFTFKVISRQGGVSTLEQFTTEGIDEAGVLGLKHYDSYVDGRTVGTGLLKKVGSTEYTYEVTEQGQTRTGKLTLERGLSSVVAAAGTLRDNLLSGKTRVLRVHLFDPDAPGSVSEAVWKSSAAPGGREAVLDLGPVTMTATLDENGLVEKAKMKVEGKLATQERLYQRGSP